MGWRYKRESLADNAGRLRPIPLGQPLCWDLSPTIAPEDVLLFLRGLGLHQTLVCSSTDIEQNIAAHPVASPFQTYRGSHVMPGCWETGQEEKRR